MGKMKNNLSDTEQPTQSQDPAGKQGKFAGDLWRLLKRYFREIETSQPKSRKPPLPGAPIRDKSILLTILGIYPYLLAGLFVYSFYWDFDDMSAILLTTSYSLEGVLKIVTVSGLIGFLTNWLAITMLFRPTHKRPLLGHGLIPAHKERIAGRLAQAVSEDLINPEIIKKRIQESDAISRYRESTSEYLKSVIDSPDFRSDLKALIVSHVTLMIRDPDVRTEIAKKVISEIDDALQDRSLEKVAIKTYTYLKGREMQELIEEALIHLPATVEKGLIRLDRMLDQLPVYMENEADQIENLVTNLIYKLVNQLDVYSLVDENLKQYDEKRLERLIRGATHEQLRYIQYLGAILGTIGGLVIWQPLISLAALGMIIGTVYILDIIIAIIRQRFKVPENDIR